MSNHKPPSSDQVRRVADLCQEDWDARRIVAWLETLSSEPEWGNTTAHQFEKATNLTHRKAIAILRRLEKIEIGFLIAFISTVVIALLSYHFFEKPFLRLKKRFTFIPSRD